MEKRLTCKIVDYFDRFKSDMKKWIEENDNMNNENKSELLQYIFDYDNLELDKDDFTKRKRIKSVVPLYMRCTAKRANGEQCTRKKKDGLCYCGTHEKNRPHGVVDINIDTSDKLTKTEVWLQEINGIMYYIDTFNNVYKTQDIISNKINPDIIAKYNCVNGVYSIPEYLHLNN